MPVLQKKALFSAFIICQVLRIIQNYMEVSPAKSLILSATIHGGSYFFIQPLMKNFVFSSTSSVGIIGSNTYFFISSWICSCVTSGSCCVDRTTASSRCGIPASSYSTVTWLLPSGLKSVSYTHLTLPTIA